MKLKIFVIAIFISYFIFITNIYFIKHYRLFKFNESENFINTANNNFYKTCYTYPDNFNTQIIHIIITRFMVLNTFNRKEYKKDYIQNGIRVMEKYLFPSLENQRCHDFIWILMVGNKTDINYIRSLINLNVSFKTEVIFENDIKKFMLNITKGFDVLITTRIDYDDQIYYDAVNDIRKAINLDKPMVLHGYNRGVIYFESDNKYYDSYLIFKDIDVMSIFASLIIVLKKVNDIYSIYDFGPHQYVRSKILKFHKLYGIKELNYYPAIIDSGEPKFIWVRQKYSGSYRETLRVKNILKEYKFNISKFYGK